MISTGRVDRYARLALEVGIKLAPGQDLPVDALVEHAPLARSVARAAYAAGARYVDVLYHDRRLTRALVELGGLGDRELQQRMDPLSTRRTVCVSRPF